MAKTVIFVDDSATVLMSVDMATQELVDKGYIQIQTYNNPTEFLEDVKNGKIFDLLITDINMPQMSGFALSKAIRDLGKKQPILALTTENTPAMKLEGKEAGINGWVTKPFTENKVVMAIKRVLKIR